METNKAIAYVVRGMRSGKSLDAISTELAGKGMTQEEIAAVFQELENRKEKELIILQASDHASSPKKKNRLYPIISVPRPTKPNRLWAFPIFGFLIKLFILLPVFFLIGGITFFALFVVLLFNPIFLLITGRYNIAAYKLVRYMLLLNTKANLFLFGITDTYPGFDATLEDGWTIAIPYPEQPNALFAIPLVGGVARLILLLPFVLYTDILRLAKDVGIVLSFAPVLFSGKYPESIYEIVVDQTRLSLASGMYFYGFSDTYPSFHISWHHKKIKIALIIAGF